LRDLTEHATRPEFVHVHKWTLHDLVMWDNRQTMHRVRRYDQSQPRDMRRATVAGTERRSSSRRRSKWAIRRPGLEPGPKPQLSFCETAGAPAKSDHEHLWLGPGLRREDAACASGGRAKSPTHARIRSTACPDRYRSCAARAGIFPRRRRRRSDPDRHRSAASHCPGFRFQLSRRPAGIAEREDGVLGTCAPGDRLQYRRSRSGRHRRRFEGRSLMKKSLECSTKPRPVSTGPPFSTFIVSASPAA